MEHGPNASETHADTAAGPFADLGACGAQERLNVRPAQIGRYRLGEDACQRPTMAAMHASLISDLDIART